MSKAFLSSLNFTTIAKVAVRDPLEAARNKMLAAVSEQLELATEFAANGKIAKRTKDKRVKAADGTWSVSKVDYVPRTWWFVHNDGVIYANVRYGNRPLVFANGKSAVVIGARDNLIPTLELIHKAVENKELDKVIMSTRKRLKKT